MLRKGEEDYLSARELAIRWNAPLRAVYSIALGGHFTGRLSGLVIYREKGSAYFSLREIMALERALSQARISLDQLIEEFRS